MFLRLMLFALFVVALPAQAALFERPLGLGMVGEDVRALQVELNKSADTRISLSGVGSPGRESDYFGVKTQQAVQRFQEKYRAEILAPNGLSRGTGFVGTSTLKLLSRLQKNTTASTPPPVSTPTTATSTPSSSVTVQETASRYTNTGGLDATFAAMERVGAKQGFTATQLALLESEMRAAASATTTNFMAEFVKRVMKDTPSPAPVTFGDQVHALFADFQKVFLPKSALAEAGIPFGGAIVSVYPCYCSASWYLTITPLPPTGVTLMNYTIGTQLYLTQTLNAPHPGIQTLGFYIVGPQCLIPIGTGCAPLPTEGNITPIVGSSL